MIELVDTFISNNETIKCTFWLIWFISCLFIQHYTKIGSYWGLLHIHQGSEMGIVSPQPKSDAKTSHRFFTAFGHLYIPFLIQWWWIDKLLYFCMMYQIYHVLGLYVRYTVTYIYSTQQTYPLTYCNILFLQWTSYIPIWTHKTTKTLEKYKNNIIARLEIILSLSHFH